MTTSVLILNFVYLVICETIFQEKYTGTTKERPELSILLRTLRKGDTIIICELTRLSRSVKDLFDLVEKIDKAGANIKSLKEPWLDTTTPQGRLLFTIFSGITPILPDTRTRFSDSPICLGSCLPRESGTYPTVSCSQFLEQKQQRSCPEWISTKSTRR